MMNTLTNEINGLNIRVNTKADANEDTTFDIICFEATCVCQGIINYVLPNSSVYIMRT